MIELTMIPEDGGEAEGELGWKAEGGAKRAGSDFGPLRHILHHQRIRREGQEREGQREGKGGETPPSDCSLTAVEMQINSSSTAICY